MNKADLVDRIAEACSISKAQATTAIDTTVDSVTAALRKGDRVALIAAIRTGLTRRPPVSLDGPERRAALGLHLPAAQGVAGVTVIEFALKRRSHMNRTALLIVAASLAGAAGLQAQTTNPLIGEMKRAYSQYKGFWTKVAARSEEHT